MIDFLIYWLIACLILTGVYIAFREIHRVTPESPEERRLRLAREAHTRSRLRAGRWTHDDREDPS